MKSLKRLKYGKFAYHHKAEEYKIMPVFVENRQLVMPGELLAEGKYKAGKNTYKVGGKVYSTKIGLVELNRKSISVIALKGCYIPSVGDVIIGKVVDVGVTGWIVDINAPYNAFLPASEAFTRPFNPKRNDLTGILDVGDVILAKVLLYDRTRNPLLTIKERGLGKITKGQIVKITPTKIPRLIGRKGSMINMLKRQTGCQITIGQNGLVHVTGVNPYDEALAILAIRIIEREAHTSGLTDRIGELIRERRSVEGE